MQLLVVAFLILVFFGATRLGDLGKGLGEGIKNFKKGISDADDPPAPKQLEDGSDADEKSTGDEQKKS